MYGNFYNFKFVAFKNSVAVLVKTFLIKVSKVQIFEIVYENNKNIIENNFFVKIMRFAWI